MTQHDSQKQHGRWAAYLGSGVAVAAATISIGTIAAWVTSLSNPPKLSMVESKFASDINEIKVNLAAQRRDLADVQTRLSTITTPSGSSSPEMQIAAVRGDLTNLTKRIDELGTAVLENPAKAVSLPLIRQDLENLKSASQKDSEATAKQIDRIYDQNKWFIGLMFTMAIGLIGLAISNFLQARSKQD